MTRRKKILLITGASIVGFIILLVVAALIVIQTSWFANFAREKIVAVLEDSTGGRAEIGSFELDLSHLTIRIRNFVLHGKEPASEEPLARVRLLEVRLKLFSGLKKVLDLRYLGIQDPRINLIILPDGTTNIPQPKTPSKPSNNSGLQTVVDLAVNRFELNNGFAKVLDQKASFSARGENLRALLNYNPLHPSYNGNVSIDPLILASGSKPPLNVKVNLPVTLESDAVRLSNATFQTPQSQIAVTASMENMKTPAISANLNARLSLVELQRSLEVPFDATLKGAPKELTLDAAARMDDKTKAISIQTAHLALGRTTLDASGQIVPGTGSTAGFRAGFALDELAGLFKVTSVQTSGGLEAQGRVGLDAQNNYRVDGRLNSRDLTIRSGTTDITGISLTTPFHADPFLISLDGLRLEALGGTLNAKLFIEKMQVLSAEANLRNFSIPVLVAAATGKRLGYDGFLNGSLNAKGDLKAKGTTGYNARANLAIAPGRRGIPINGLITATYNGANGALDVGNSYIGFPNSRLTIAGALNRRIDVGLRSTNLADFLPAINFGAEKPQTSLPVVLQPGGSLSLTAQLTGNTGSPRITGHLETQDFAVEQHPFDRLAADLAASSSGAAIQHGNLLGPGVNAAFDGSIGLVQWKPLPRSPLSAAFTMHNADLAALMGLAGQSRLNAAGVVNADVHVYGTYGNPLGGAVLQVANGSVEQQDFSKLYVKADLADQLVSLSQLELDTAGGQITASGKLQHPRESFSTGQIQFAVGVRDIHLGQIQALAKQNAGIAGVINLSAAGTADLQENSGKSTLLPGTITADLSARNLQIQNQDAGELTATARTLNKRVQYDLRSNFAGSRIEAHGNTALTGEYATVADLSIDDLSVQKALQIAGQGSVPASGDFSAKAHVQGTMKSPDANLSFALRHANVYQEPIDSFTGGARYSGTRVEISSLNLNVPAGNVSLSGSFDHPANNFQAGNVNLKLTTSDIYLERIRHIRDQKPGLGGTLHADAYLSGRLSQRAGKTDLLLSTLNADTSLAGVHLNDRQFGGLNFNARTAGSKLNFRLDSDLAQSSIHGAGQAELSGEYPVQANLSFNNIRYSNLAPLLSQPTAGPNPYEALVEGKVAVNGPMLNPDNMAGTLELSRLDLHTNPAASPTGGPSLRTVVLQNKGPIRITLNRDVVTVEQLHIAGRNTMFNAAGTVNLRNAAEPLNLKLDANIDLGLLQDADKDFYSSGLIAINAGIHGTFAQPRAIGEIDLKNANVNYAEAPNGISNANGVILLNGTNATIKTLTGESGGGKISVTGFVGMGTGIPAFNLDAAANHVRVRYSGISVTSNAKISLTGNTRRSLLAGTVSIERIAYASSSDAGSLLSQASTPPSTPSAPSPLLAGMRLAIHVVTAPDIQVVSTYANRLSIIANLTVRGTAENPGMLGRVTVTDGQLVFFGNTYTVTTGTINFYNPNEILPVLNVSLETIAQGVNVTLGVSGPMNDLKLSYRSDPPLTFEQIVQLLATNTTPANPVIAAHQPAPPQQSLSQMGESAVLSQAVANPLANRVQRVFGLTQFKIDPSFGGSNGQPSARVTLQQKITSNLTFTYITDVTQTNGQIIRVQLDLTDNLSAVALRDYNGNVSLEMFYKFTRR